MTNTRPEQVAHLGLGEERALHIAGTEFTLGLEKLAEFLRCHYSPTSPGRNNPPGGVIRRSLSTLNHAPYALPGGLRRSLAQSKRHPGRAEPGPDQSANA